jgi:hypothetical protein
MANEPAAALFDTGHYASGFLQKLRRSLELGPKYYSFDLPRYFAYRRTLGLSGLDWRAALNPLRELRRRTYVTLPTPPFFAEALERCREAGIHFTMPRERLEALVGAWWSVREVTGDVIECGAYQGATSLLLARLGMDAGLSQRVLMLDTFAGMPRTSLYDVSRQAGEFAPPNRMLERIGAQAAALGVTDRVEVHQGLFADTFAGFRDRDLRFAFVHIDANIYQGTWDACAYTLPRVTAGGAVVFDDYNGVCDLGARLAIDRYLGDQSSRLVPLAGSSALLHVSTPPPRST